MTQRRSRWLLWFVLLAALVAALIGSGLVTCSGRQPRSGEYRRPLLATRVPTRDAGSKTGAYVVCKKFVAARLKAPTTAKFPTSRDMKIEKGYGTTDTWTVIGYVDAQNSFGAMIRSTYLCKVEYKGRNNWSLLDIMIE